MSHLEARSYFLDLITVSVDFSCTHAFHYNIPSTLEYSYSACIAIFGFSLLLYYCSYGLFFFSTFVSYDHTISERYFPQCNFSY